MLTLIMAKVEFVGQEYPRKILYHQQFPVEINHTLRNINTQPYFLLFLEI